MEETRMVPQKPEEVTPGPSTVNAIPPFFARRFEKPLVVTPPARVCKHCKVPVTGPWAIAIWPRFEEGYCTEACFQDQYQKAIKKDEVPESEEARLNRTVKFL